MIWGLCPPIFSPIGHVGGGHLRSFMLFLKGALLPPPPHLGPKFCFKMGENGIWPPPSPSPTCKYSVLHIYCGILYLMWVKNINAQRIRSIFSDFRLFLRFGPFFKNENFYCKQSQKHTISHKRSKVAKSMANDVWIFFWILSRGF